MKPIEFKELVGFESDDLEQAWDVFKKSAHHIKNQSKNLRQARLTPKPFLDLCLNVSEIKSPKSRGEACDLWMRYFQPYQSSDRTIREAAFVTAYFEPILKGSLQKTREYSEPILGLPDQTARTSGAKHILPERAMIDAGCLGDQAKPLVWLQDAIEVFMVQVQGSARVELTDGTQKRLIYAGRNNHPYTSIGKLLIDREEIPLSAISPETIREWVRKQGQGPEGPGRKLLHENKSYVFFDLVEDFGHESGPIGGQGISLTPLRSIAIDRHLWFYGLPIWIEAQLPWDREEKDHFARLMIAQDTGSAIIGGGRIDIFFGSGEQAGVRAGQIRHQANLVYLLPKMALQL